MALRALISLCLIVSLTLVGFGHRTLGPNTDARATAYVLAGGDWSDICGQSGDPRHAQSDRCIACVIAGGCLAPRMAELAQPDRDTRLLWRTPERDTHTLSELEWSYAARAPPLA
ncbi:hypothetical protein [Loktanella sp. S4079]|uniref:hypothetical protein n=1 Tax=Loktanella sp. S4079 TaxID=579483 RepID=UPI000696C6DC|nr:hypothetical protein [Loktanella sp. S4079]